MHQQGCRKDKKCGCFYCLEIFDPKEIEDWDEDVSGTAICPYCGVDAVIGEHRGYPITTEFLKKMQEYWFNDEQEDAHRNALNAHCYWMLRKEGRSVHEATNQLEGKSVAYKNELLFQRGINFDELPSWQKRGVGIWWNDEEKDGYNPVTKETVKTTRRVLKTECELPLREEYAGLIAGISKSAAV